MRRALAVALVAFAARGALLLRLGPDVRFALTPDSPAYEREAVNLARAGVFSLSPAPPLVADTVRTPAYPYFLSWFVRGDAVRARVVQWTQALLGAATAALIFQWALVLWENEGAALFAGLCAALDPILLLHAPLLLTETLFFFLFSAGLLALALGVKKNRLSAVAAAGLSFGLSALTRPVALYFFVAAAAAAGWSLRKEKKAALFLAVLVAASAVLPLAWMARNKRASGVFTFCSIQGLNFVVRCASVQAELDGTPPDHGMAKISALLAHAHPQAYASTADEARFKGAWAAKFIAAHPVGYLRVMAKDVVKLLGGHGGELFAWLVLKDGFYDPMNPRETAGGGGFSGTRLLLDRCRSSRLFIPLYILALGAGYALTGVGLIGAFNDKKKRWGAFLCASVIVYYLGVTAGLGAYYRLRIPLLGAVYALAGWGWTLVRAPSGGRRPS